MSDRDPLDIDIFSNLESDVRGYSRSWPAVFDRAIGSILWDEQGKEYIDFFSGAGALNYGHNNALIKQPLIDYLQLDRIIHSLDMFTTARRKFLTSFNKLILEPRNLDYKVMFPGPAGTNAVEAALKLARKASGRTHIVNFTNAFHGMSLGALAVTGNSFKRKGAGVPLDHVTTLPFDGYLSNNDGFEYFKKLLNDSGSGFEPPAAVIVETVQGEGGLNVARTEWLQELSKICTEHEILLIIDDVQMGCGRTGDFFSFEESGVVPDIVCLSKSISASGLPLALTLFRSDLDIWSPGEHNGTFRGIAPAFETASVALDIYWSDQRTTTETLRKGLVVKERLKRIVEDNLNTELVIKGRGLARGLECQNGALAESICANAFERGLLMETSGPESSVVKLLPALTISDQELSHGLDLLEESVAFVLKNSN